VAHPLTLLVGLTGEPTGALWGAGVAAACRK